VSSDAPSSLPDVWWPLVNFLFGCVFGVVALYAFLEYLDWRAMNEGNDDDDGEDDIP